MNITKTIITILLLLCNQFAFAQKEPIPYEWLEEQSKIISDIQVKASGRILKFDNGATEKLDFKEGNFKVWSHDYSTTWTVNILVNNDVPAFLILENIDLSQTLGIYCYEGVIYLQFPYHLLTHVYMNEEIFKINKNPLDLYYLKEDEDKMLSTVYHLITRLKINKGLLSEAEAKKQWEDYPKLKPYEFYQKYPNSILAYEGKMIEEEHLKKVKEKQKADLINLTRSQEYVLKLAKKYNYYPRMTIEQFGAMSPKNEKLAKKAKRKNESEFIVTGSIKKNGPMGIRVNNGFITFLSFMIDQNGWSDDLAIKEFNLLFNDIKTNIDPKYFTFSKSQNNDKESKWAKITIEVPGIKLNLIEINLIYSNSLMNYLTIFFYETK